MLGIRKVLSALTSPFRAEHITPLRDWDLNPILHPLEVERGYAGHLVDGSGRDFIDLNSAWGVNLLGYGYPAVAEAIRAQAGRFSGVGVPYPEFWELGRRLCEIIPGADAVRYGKNGSDATMGAVRLARAITGRELVLHRGYHGFHDWWMASVECPGVPDALRGMIETLPDLAPETIERAFHRHGGKVACLIFDPMLPPIATAAEVREIADIVHKHGALLIFDEIVSGFRLAPGGAQEMWGVAPDLSCFGKAIANGMPLSVLAGRQGHMNRLPEINYGMTFEGEAISIAAASATLTEVIEKNVCPTLAEKGRRLKDDYARAAASHAIQTELAGPDARPGIFFASQGGLTGRELRWLCIQELARDGIITVGALNLCFSHDDADLEAVSAAFRRALDVVGQAIDRGSVDGLMDKRLHASMRIDQC